MHGQKPPIVHRDIKPSNLIRRTDGTLVLVDFGAAQVVQGTVGGSTVVGTSGYMPMEQYVGNASPGSDLYALGATAVYLLTGTTPIDLPTERMRLQFEPLVDASANLVEVLQCALEPHVEDRPQSVDELRALLDGGSGRQSLAVVKPTSLARPEPEAWVAVRKEQVGWLRHSTKDGVQRILVATDHSQQRWSYRQFCG